MKCSLDSCEREIYCKDFCEKHYRRILKHGDVNHGRYRHRPEPRPCETCRNIFTPSRKRFEAKFCSKSCQGKSPAGQERARKMGKENAEKISKALRGRGNGKSYKKYMGRHEHRMIAEKIIGRALLKGEVVHHKDGNKLNNSPDNISITTQSQHIKEHGIPYWSHKQRREIHDLRIQARN